MVSIESQSQVIHLVEGQRLTASACRRYIFKVVLHLTNLISNSGTIWINVHRVRYGSDIASLKGLKGGRKKISSTRMTNLAIHQCRQVPTTVNKSNTRGKLFKRPISSEKAYFTRNIQATGVIWKPWLSSFKWGMIALSAMGNSCVAAQNIELHW